MGNSKSSHRMAMLKEMNLSEADRALIAPEIEEFDRIIEELEAFAGETPWVSAQIYPSKDNGRV